MPVYLEPNRLFPVVLKSDEDRSPKPTFWAVSLSMRMQNHLSEVLDKWHEEDVNTSVLFTETIEAILKYVQKLENMPGAELNAEWLMDNLTYQEAREILGTILFNNHLNHDLKKV